jgi:hypothetical protein
MGLVKFGGRSTGGSYETAQSQRAPNPDIQYFPHIHGVIERQFSSSCPSTAIGRKDRTLMRNWKAVSPATTEWANDDIHR